MCKVYRNRLALICVFAILLMVAFFVLSAPILSDGENDRHSILSQLLGRHSAIVDFDLGIALSSTLLMIFPLSFAFLMFDLYGLRKAPVQHLGIFAYCLIAVVVNILASLGIWLICGGWGPPAVGSIMAIILVASLIHGTISEWKIFTSADCAEEIAA